MRRSRYTATMRDGTQRVILAYSPQGVKAYYGNNCVSVVKGDFRIQVNPSGWTLDNLALKRAAESLGLTRRVYVRKNGKPGGTNGTYRARSATADAPVRAQGWYHHIVVKSYLTPEQATATLWHELQHAQQAERAGSPEAWRLKTASERSYPYQQRPSEVEARSLAETNKHIRLAKRA